jgi:hypothetical protein
MDLMAAVLTALDVGTLAEEQNHVIADSSVRLRRAEIELAKLKGEG